MPLLWAAYQGNLEVAQVLVDAGAALSATDKARPSAAARYRARRARAPDSAAHARAPRAGACA